MLMKVACPFTQSGCIRCHLNGDHRTSIECLSCDGLCRSSRVVSEVHNSRTEKGASQLGSLSSSRYGFMSTCLYGARRKEGNEK